MDIDEYRRRANDIVRDTGNVFVGEEVVLRKLLCSALANGHVLFEDKPGLGKTLLAKAFARITGCNWSRVQFTPDLMPVDILGTRIWRSASQEFQFERGPVFTNILLADEINRSPPKTQSALLEAMEERQVTVEGKTYVLPRPFFVIATQNPIEQEGTFPLPEAQMDRFLLKMATGYVRTAQLESEILRRRIRWKADDPTANLPPALDQDTFTQMQNLVERDIYVDDQILDYVSTIVRATREHAAIEVGASPRAGLSLLKVSRAHAAMCGRDFVTPDDVKMFMKDALCHRMIMKMEYELNARITTQRIVDDIVMTTPVPMDFARK